MLFCCANRDLDGVKVSFTPKISKTQPKAPIAPLKSTALAKANVPATQVIIIGLKVPLKSPSKRQDAKKPLRAFLGAKSHTFMMNWLATQTLNEYREINKDGSITLYQWKNNVPLYTSKNVYVNYFCQKVIIYDSNGKEKIRSTRSWVTDLEVDQENIALFVRGAKTRWKIENECFNCLQVF